jgi:hypothetical protein
MRTPITLFRADEMQSAAALKAQLEWDQEVRQRAHEELQKHDSREPFAYEPHNYEWCASATPTRLVELANAGDNAALSALIAGGGASINAVTGEVTPLYVLCAWKNSDLACRDHSER